MPFLDELDLLLAFLPHALPFDQLPALCLLFDPIAHGRYHHHQPEKARRRDLVLVQRHRERDANKDARGHDNGEDDGAKILDGVEDEELSDRGADREEEEVDLDLRVATDEGEGRPEHAVMEQSDQRQRGGEGRGREHQLDHGKVAVSLEHATLPLGIDETMRCTSDVFRLTRKVCMTLALWTYLTSETVEEQKQEKQQDPGPLGTTFFSVDIRVERQVVGGRHEHGNSDPGENRHKVVILGICCVRGKRTLFLL